MLNLKLTETQERKIKHIVTPPNNVHDNDFVERVKKGDVEAYGGIMRRYNQQVFRVARSFVKNDAEAMDIVQESHIKAFSRIEEYKGNSSFLVWLYAITRNEALMYLRKRKTEQTMKVVDINSLDVLSNKDNGDSDFHDDHQQSFPEKVLENQQLKDIINAHVDGLPENFRTVFVLRAIEQQSVKDTAMILQLKEETVKTRFFRAKRLLRDKIQSYLDIAGMHVYEFGGEHCDIIIHNVMLKINTGEQ